MTVELNMDELEMSYRGVVPASGHDGGNMLIQTTSRRRRSSLPVLHIEPMELSKIVQVEKTEEPAKDEGKVLEKEDQQKRKSRESGRKKSKSRRADKMDRSCPDLGGGRTRQRRTGLSEASNNGSEETKERVSTNKSSRVTRIDSMDRSCPGVIGRRQRKSRSGSSEQEPQERSSTIKSAEPTTESKPRIDSMDQSCPAVIGHRQRKRRTSISEPSSNVPVPELAKERGSTSKGTEATREVKPGIDTVDQSCPVVVGHPQRQSRSSSSFNLGRSTSSSSRRSNLENSGSLNSHFSKGNFSKDFNASMSSGASLDPAMLLHYAANDVSPACSSDEEDDNMSYNLPGHLMSSSLSRLSGSRGQLESIEDKSDVEDSPQSVQRQSVPRDSASKLNDSLPDLGMNPKKLQKRDQSRQKKTSRWESGDPRVKSSSHPVDDSPIVNDRTSPRSNRDTEKADHVNRTSTGKSTHPVNDELEKSNVSRKPSSRRERLSKSDPGIGTDIGTADDINRNKTGKNHPGSDELKEKTNVMRKPSSRRLSKSDHVLGIDATMADDISYSKVRKNDASNNESTDMPSIPRKSSSRRERLSKSDHGLSLSSSSDHGLRSPTKRVKQVRRSSETGSRSLSRPRRGNMRPSGSSIKTRSSKISSDEMDGSKLGRERTRSSRSAIDESGRRRLSSEGKISPKPNHMEMSQDKTSSRRLSSSRNVPVGDSFMSYESSWSSGKGHSSSRRMRDDSTRSHKGGRGMDSSIKRQKGKNEMKDVSGKSHKMRDSSRRRTPRADTMDDSSVRVHKKDPRLEGSTRRVTGMDESSSRRYKRGGQDELKTSSSHRRGKSDQMKSPRADSLRHSHSTLGFTPAVADSSTSKKSYRRSSSALSASAPISPSEDAMSKRPVMESIEDDTASESEDAGHQVEDDLVPEENYEYEGRDEPQPLPKRRRSSVSKVMRKQMSMPLVPKNDVPSSNKPLRKMKSMDMDKTLGRVQSPPKNKDDGIMNGSGSDESDGGHPHESNGNKHEKVSRPRPTVGRGSQSLMKVQTTRLEAANMRSLMNLLQLDSKREVDEEEEEETDEKKETERIEKAEVKVRKSRYKAMLVKEEQKVVEIPKKKKKKSRRSSLPVFESTAAYF